MVRVAALIVLNGSVLLIQRGRPNDTYYLFPGGHIESGESPEEALVREIREEVGLQVTAGHLVASVSYRGDLQLYYTAYLLKEPVSALSGDEEDSAVWLPVDGLGRVTIQPRAVSELLARRGQAWPPHVLVAVDAGRSRFRNAT